MTIQLIKGSFDASDAIELMQQLVQVKIKFHEMKINASHNEEDIKMRENRIKQLQDDFGNARDYLKTHSNYADMDCTLSIA